MFHKKGLSESDCEDLTQEVFVSVYRNMATLRAPEQLEAWLFTVARNAFYNHLERQKAQKRSAQMVDLEDEGGRERAVSQSQSALEELLHREKVDQLYTALQALPQQMRRCVTAWLVDDLSYEEIAVKSGISLNTVKAHLFQARQRLSARLRGYFDGVDFE